MNPDEDRRARMQFMFAFEGGSVFWSREISRRGSIEVLARLKSGHYLQQSPSATRKIHETNVDELEKLISDANTRFIIPDDAEWPTQLNDLEAPPIALCLRGAADLRGLALCSIAIVGARAASNYGSRLASELALQLGERGWNVISGAAYGIDAAAHRGALAYAGKSQTFQSAYFQRPASTT